MTPLILVPSRIVSLIAAERSSHLPNETGGFLIGIRRGAHIEVTGLTMRGAGDVATHASFERRCRSHRDQIHAAWRASDRFESLIGDWHCHPYGSGSPSDFDRSAWRTLAQAVHQPIVGMIMVEATTPRLFLTTSPADRRSRELRLVEIGEDAVVYGDRTRSDVTGSETAMATATPSRKASVNSLRRGRL